MGFKEECSLLCGSPTWNYKAGLLAGVCVMVGGGGVGGWGSLSAFWCILSQKVQ